MNTHVYKLKEFKQQLGYISLGLFQHTKYIKQTPELQVSSEEADVICDRQFYDKRLTDNIAHLSHIVLQEIQSLGSQTVALFQFTTHHWIVLNYKS